LARPGLVTVGAHDLLSPPPPSLSRGVHAMLKGSEFAVIEQGSHFAPYQAPDVLAARVGDFLNRRVNQAVA
jgi:pimeloyl-ACP methyl ester carboxylesterase